MDAIKDFMTSSLVTWVRTFENDGGKGLSYSAIADGVFLCDVMNHISPRSGFVGTFGTLNRCPEDSHARLRNLSILTAFIDTFYKEFLNQTLLSSFPDIVKLSRVPETPEGVTELRKLLLLVLGCAVQSPLKEDVISSITNLPLETQHEIVECIQEITDNPETVWPSEWGQLEGVPDDSVPRAYSLLMAHCKRLVYERDKIYKEYLKYLLGDTESAETEDNVHHLGVQLAEAKAHLRRLRQEHDEKVESYAEVKEELEELKQTVTKLRQENVELVQEARSSRASMDEADMLRERASKVDSLEAEVSRYRDKMADIEFYKTRVDELREDNRILVETKEMLEDQLSTARRRADQVLDLENKILQMKQQINNLNIERDADRERLRCLTEENAQLALTTRSSFTESATLAAQMENLKRSNRGSGTNVDSDLMGDAKTRVLKLELENQRLEGEIERLKRENRINYEDKLVELEKENKRLSVKVTHLQEKSQKDKAQMMETQETLQSKEKETRKLQDVINTVKMNAERQTAELQNENCQLQDLIETLRERQKKTTDDQLCDVENENRNLIDTNIQLQSQVNRLEYEKHQLNKLTERLRESSEKLVEVELQKSEIEKENKELNMAIVALKESCEKHEKIEESYASLEVEFTRVSKILENTKYSLAKLESVQCEKEQLQIDVEKLKRSLEKLKLSSGRLADLETERDQLLTQSNQLTRQLESLKMDCGKLDHLELEMISANNEVQRVRRANDVIQKKLSVTEREKGEIEAENTKLQRSVEILKLSTKKLNELERDLTEVEATNDRLDRENKSMKKEGDRLRSSLEVKDKLVEETCSKLSKLERENKKLNKESEVHKVTEESVRAVEQEKRELEHQIALERKTLSALREDLVAEKVKSQQLSNKLEGIQSDLSKLGLNANNISTPVPEEGEDRYKALETMLEETLKRSVEIREEKITSLQTRLKESTMRNQQLKHQLLEVRSDYESLVQRTQEEGNELLSYDSLKEVARAKEVARRTNEEKMCLENDVSALTSQNSSYRDQVCALQSQVTSVSNQNTALSQLNGALQSDNAKLQVENTTFQSQSASLIAHNSSLESSVTQLTNAKDKLKKLFDERGLKLNQLVVDHESLQKLHEQLNQEFEKLTGEHNVLKSLQKVLKGELKILKERETKVSSNEDDLIKLKVTLEAEMQNLKNDSNSLANLRAEHSRLKDDFRCLFTTNERVRTEYKNLQDDYKTVKSENNSLKLKLLEFGGELNETKDQMATLDVEATKLTNKCQMLEGVNQSLEEDRRSLMSQVSLLLTQYHDLLTQTLEDKQHFHQEEKNFTDKLNNLRRQKEKLEEKIMEQYRRMDNSHHKKLSPGCVPYSKGFGSNLVKKVRKAGNDLISKVPRTARSRSRNRDDLDSPDSSSIGSSPTHDSLDSGSDTRRSSPHLASSPALDGGSLTLAQGPHFASSPALNGGSVAFSHTAHNEVKENGLRQDCSEVYSGGNSLSSDEHVSGVESSVIDGPTSVDFPPTGRNVELTRAGSRRGLYLARDTSGANEADRTSICSGGPAVRSSSSSSSTSLSNHSRNIIMNGSVLSSVPGTPKSSSISSCGTPVLGGPPPQSTSTPKFDCRSSNAPLQKTMEEDENSGTPKLPPRMDQSIKSAPELPPRASRRVSARLSDSDPLSSSQSTSANGTPELRHKGLPPPGRNASSTSKSPEIPVKPDPQQPPKEVVDNSIWYEYGCV